VAADHDVALRIPPKIAERVRQLSANPLIRVAVWDGQEQRCRQNQERRSFDTVEAADNVIGNFIVDAAADPMSKQISQKQTGVHGGCKGARADLATRGRQRLQQLL